MRLIDADELKIDYGFTWDDIAPTHEELYELIDRQPTIEERKRGEWCNIPDPMAGEGYWRCSECGLNVYTCTDYCPDCGADMRGETDEAD